MTSTTDCAPDRSAARAERLRRREERERLAYEGAARRSAPRGESLRVPAAVVRRYEAVAWGARPLLSREQLYAWVGPPAGKRVLEICCHDAEHGAVLALLGASVDAVDISEPWVEAARRRAEVNGLEGRLRPAVMSAHDLRFPEGTFDVVFGKAALHHLDLEAARREVLRVLKPGGLGVFAEPVCFSPVLRRLRPLLPPRVNRESPDERQLTSRDLDLFCEPFTDRRTACFYLLGRLHRLTPALGGALTRLDARLLRRFPRLGRWSGICALAVTKPAAAPH